MSEFLQHYSHWTGLGLNFPYQTVDALIDAVSGITATGVLSYPCSFVVRKNGDVWEAINSAHSLAYGGTGDAGSVDGTSFSAVTQAAINAVEASGGGTIAFYLNGTSPTYSDGLTVEEGNIVIVNDGTSWTYEGTGVAFTAGTSAARKTNISVNNLTIAGAGATSIFRVLESDLVKLNNCTANSATSGNGFLIDGGATWTSLTALNDCSSGNCLKGITHTNTCHATKITGGYLWRSSVGSGDIGLETNSASDQIKVYGLSIEDFSTGAYINGHYSAFYDLILEDCTLGINCIGGSPASYDNLFSHPIFASCDTDRTDNGTNNTWIGTMYGVVLPKFRRALAVDSTNIALYMGDSAGSNGIYFYAKDTTQVGYITSVGNAQFNGALTLGGAEGITAKKFKAVAGSNIPIVFTTNDGSTFMSFVDSDAAEQAYINSNGKVTSYGGFETTQDCKVNSQTKGFTIKDRTTATLYRIYVDNGSLAVEAV